MTGERILVVEDNEKNMKLFRDILVATGYRTLEATTGGEAIDMASEHTPDLVLMDIQLPDLDGVAGALSIAGERAHGDDPRSCADRTSHARVPRAVPGGGFRRLRVEACERAGAPSRPSGNTAKDGPDERRRYLILVVDDVAPNVPAARGRAHAARLRRRLRDRRGARAGAGRVGQA